MAYKDKDLQRATTRARVARFRVRQRGRTGVTPSVTPSVTPMSEIDRSNSAAVEPAMRARIEAVQPSNGTGQDDVRAASDRLVAALGSPAIEPIPELDADGNLIPEY